MKLNLVTQYVIRLSDFLYITNVFLEFITFFSKWKNIQSNAFNLSLIFIYIYSRPFVCSIMFLNDSFDNSSSKLWRLSRIMFAGPSSVV